MRIITMYLWGMIRRMLRRLLCMLILILVALYLFSGCQKQEPISSQGDPEGPQNETVLTDGSQILIKSERFIEMDFCDGDNTLVGKTGYKNRSDDIRYREDWKNSLSLQDTGRIYGPTGHKIYKSSDGNQYILSGGSPVWLGNGNVLDLNRYHGFLREEGTGKLIKTFITQSELDMFLAGYEEGQAILKGELACSAGSIIYDGVLTPFTFEGEVGPDTRINLAQLALWTAPDYFDYEPGDSYLEVSVNEFYSLQVKTELLAQSNYDRYDVNIVDGTYRFTSDGIALRVELLDPDEPTITLHNASRMFGWTIFTDGESISILSDETNLTDKAIIYNPNHISLKTKIERDENNDLVSNTYDRFGNLIESEKYDGVDDEYMQSIVPKK